jgi:hypothetical protein
MGNEWWRTVRNVGRLHELIASTSKALAAKSVRVRELEARVKELTEAQAPGDHEPLDGA